MEIAMTSLLLKKKTVKGPPDQSKHFFGVMLFCPESEVLQRAKADRAYGNEIPKDIRRRLDHQSQNARTNRTVNQDLVMC